MTRDRASLQRWYRQAMVGRAAQLRGLVGELASGSPEARREARAIGMALRGSGATFGFPNVTEVAALLETAADDDVLRRAEGLISYLTALDREGEGPALADLPPEWVIRAAGHRDTVRPEWAEQGGWSAVARSAGIDLAELTRRAADYLGLEVADLSRRSSSASRLVPEAFVTSARVVPLGEDAETITVATADPTSLTTELELELLTGRRPIFTLAPPEAIDAVVDRTVTSDPVARAGVEPAVETASGGGEGPDAAGVRAAGTGGTSDASTNVARAAEGAVLVVDDEPSARLLVRTILEREGYEVVEAGDGVEALETIADGGGVGLVVADLNMPRMDGLELIWQLRDAHATRLTPVIIVTGESDEILETQLMEEGADDYIPKPVDPRLFLARVESTLRRVGARVTRQDRTGGRVDLSP